MKTTRWAYLLLAFLLTSGTPTVAHATTPEPVRIVAIGDSNTLNGYGAGTDWPTMASQKLGGRVVIENAGIYRNSSAAMLARFDTDVIQKHPDAVIITTGSVDLQTYGADEDAVVANVQAMVGKARAAGIRPIVGGAPPLDQPDFRGPMIRLTFKLGTWATAEHIPVLNLHTPVATWAGGYKDGLAKDWVHPNEAGRAVLADKAAGELGQMFIPNYNKTAK